MKEIAKAIIKVTEGIKGVDKDITVGSGSYGYAGISEKMVKTVVKKLMIDNGLSILPISVKANTQVDRWEDNGKSKQSVFTEVETKYLLLHTSGESIELGGYGQGVDAQDKGAGKATTYALKNTLMNTFLMITGEDTEDVHSQDMEVVQKIKPKFDDTALKNLGASKHLFETYEVAIKKSKEKYQVSKDMEDKITLLYNT